METFIFFSPQREIFHNLEIDIFIFYYDRYQDLFQKLSSKIFITKIYRNIYEEWKYISEIRLGLMKPDQKKTY